MQEPSGARNLSAASIDMSVTTTGPIVLLACWADWLTLRKRSDLISEESSRHGAGMKADLLARINMEGDLAEGRDAVAGQRESAGL